MPSGPEIEAASIVVLGSFNPAMFHPLWFKMNQLIRPEEAESAKLEVTHPQISIFSLEWCRLQVETGRFVVEVTDRASFGLISDLVLGTFTILDQTPITAMGLNRSMHFKMDSREKWHAFGDMDMLAPKEVWAKIMAKPGLVSLIMQEPRETPEGFLRVKVEPSGRIDPGIFIEMNNHYTLDKKSVADMLKILTNSWKDILKNAEDIADYLLKRSE
jgi:hypothetical protein